MVDLIVFFGEGPRQVQWDVDSSGFQDALQFKEDRIGGEADADMDINPVNIGRTSRSVLQKWKARSIMNR